MTEASAYAALVWVWTALGIAMLPVLLARTAPYGRHTPASVRWALPSRIGWIVMESPSVLVFATCFVVAPPPTWVPYLLLGLWQAHYLNRTLVHPFRMRGADRPMPLPIVGSALLFTTVNGYLNGRAVTRFALHDDGWLRDPRLAAGVALFLLGMAVNLHSDRILFRLRRPGEHGYAIPRGGLHRYVSCPNYLGEIVEWCGWALASWSLAGLSFAVWTIANLLPRALAHHRWYRERFPDYPPERRALVPGLL